MLSRRSPNSGKKKMLSLTAIAFIKHLTSRRGARSSCQPLIGPPPPPHRPPPIIPSSARTSSKRISTSCQRCFRSSCQARCGGRRAAPDVNDGLIKAPCVFTQRVSARPLAGRARGRQRTPRGHPLSLPTGLCTPLQKPTVG